jgi:tetratricopeptide (TPR) repeat protein
MTESRPPLRDSYEQVLNRARLAFRSGNPEEAIALYRRLVDKLSRLSERVLDRRPELRDLHRDTRLELAAILRFEGRYAEAIEVTEVLLETHPDDADAWRTDVAILRMSKGEVETGLAELRALAEKDPANPWRWTTLGREARIEGYLADSQAALDRAALVGSEGDARQQAENEYQRFLLFGELGQHDDAVAAWEQAVQWHDEVGTTIRQVYTMLTDAGRYSDALRYVEQEDNALQAGFQRGIIAQRTGNAALARQEWQQVAQLTPDEFDAGHDAWVESVLRLGDPEPALEWLQDNLGQRGSSRLLVLSGIGWAMRQDGELATVLLQQAINLTRRERPPRKKLGSDDWRLLDSLVADDEIKASLRTYFAVVDTLWEQSPVLPQAGNAPPLITRP